MTQPGPDVSVRLAWPTDAPAIVAVQHDVWRERWPDAAEFTGRQELTAGWTRIIESAPDARIRALVALERAAVRGAALVHPSHDHDADPVADAEIGEWLIASAHRRQGHGSRLLQACIDTVRADRFSRVVWWVDSTDDATRAFAIDAGWGPDGAHRELADDTGRSIKQVRLHTSIA